jgi:hypothetical protein
MRSRGGLDYRQIQVARFYLAPGLAEGLLETSAAYRASCAWIMYGIMRFDDFSFGRRKKPSEELRENYGHTPLSSKEEIPWGDGAGSSSASACTALYR